MTITLQRFKETDATEAKYIACALPALEGLEADLDDFYAGAENAQPLGDVLFELQRDPLAAVLTQEVFRASFFAIHEMFTRPGTFEFYLEVFRAIWGDDVEIEFSVPAAGKLIVGVGELNVLPVNWLARRIVAGAYVYDRVVDTLDEDAILVQDAQGTKNQSEVNALVRELAPAGIYTVVTLTV